jgi:hypothetical protein
MGSLALRPGDSLTIPRMALSVGFIRFVSSTDATQATRLLTLTLVGLTPTEHASLRWTHLHAIISITSIAFRYGLAVALPIDSSDEHSRFCEMDK